MFWKQDEFKEESSQFCQTLLGSHYDKDREVLTEFGISRSISDLSRKGFSGVVKDWKQIPED